MHTYIAGLETNLNCWSQKHVFFWSPKRKITIHRSTQIKHEIVGEIGSKSLSKDYYKVRWSYYKMRKLSLLQSAMDSYYKLRQLFYYQVRHGLLQIATDITKCDDYYKLRQYGTWVGKQKTVLPCINFMKGERGYGRWDLMLTVCFIPEIGVAYFYRLLN